MADKGTVGLRFPPPPAGHGPKLRRLYGTLSITGTAQLNEVPGAAVVWLFDSVGMTWQSVCQAKADGSFALYNLAAGRYILVIHGQQTYLPGIFAVDVS